MILVDTSVWIDHLRKSNSDLSVLLEQDQVLVHPFVVGELSCGVFRNRREVIELLEKLPQVDLADHKDVLRFVERHALFGKGVGWIDVHLIAAARLARAHLWTLDKRLRSVAALCDVAWLSRSTSKPMT